MNRTDLQTLAAERIRDAQQLLLSGNWSGAYYLGGYAVECGLKASIAKLTNQYDFPDKDRTKDSYTHDLERLTKTAELDAMRQRESLGNPAFAANWQIVKDWDESARYSLCSETRAREFIEAITNPQDGVMSWIMVHW